LGQQLWQYHSVLECENLNPLEPLHSFIQRVVGTLSFHNSGTIIFWVFGASYRVISWQKNVHFRCDTAGFPVSISLDRYPDCFFLPWPYMSMHATAIRVFTGGVAINFNRHRVNDCILPSNSYRGATRSGSHLSRKLNKMTI